MLLNSDVCRMFIEKKGIEAALRIFSFPLPVSVSLGQSISAASKNFSSQHSAALARCVCSFFKEHLSATNELLDSFAGRRLAELETAKQIMALKCLSSLEGGLSLFNLLLKGSATIVSELGAGDADVVKDTGKIYREVLWQISLSSDPRVVEKRNVQVEIVLVLGETVTMRLISQQAIDLDHPDSPKTANFIVRALDSLTCAANSSEQAIKTDSMNKKKSALSQGRSDEPVVTASVNVIMDHNHGHVGVLEAAQPVEIETRHAVESCSSEANHVSSDRSLEETMVVGGALDANPTMELGMEFLHGEMEEVGALNVGNQPADDDIGDEDDDMGEDGDEEDEDEGEDEDEDIAEDGAAMMSLGDTDMEDHEDAGLEDEYNDEMVGDEDDDYHDNRVIEVRWREALDGFDLLQVLGQSRSGILDFNSEPSVGMGSLQLSRHRGSADGRWTDDGLPQAGGLASAVAQTVEELFVSLLCCNSPADDPVRRQPPNTMLEEKNLSDAPLGEPKLEVDNLAGQPCSPSIAFTTPC
ncbi:E3 ubiquitin-protein ligase upl1 [Dionaea muscipula]